MFEKVHCFADFAFFSSSQILNLLTDSTVKSVINKITLIALNKFMSTANFR